MNLFELDFFTAILLISIYIAFPLMLQLIGKIKQGTTKSRIVSIVNSVIITFILYVFQDAFFSYDASIELCFATGGLFYAINEYFIFKINSKKKDFKKTFMTLSLIFIVLSMIKSGLVFGYLSFVASFGGLLVCGKAEKIHRFILYGELFFGINIVCLMMLSFIISDISLLLYSPLLSILVYVLLYFFVFKREKTKNEVISKKKKNKKIYVNDKTVKKIVIVFDILVFLGVIIWVASSANDDKYIYSCPFDYTLKGKKCYGTKTILADINYYCTRGTLEGSRCFTESYSNPVDKDVCPDGYHLAGFKCQKDGTHWDYDKCGSFDFTYSFLKERCYEKINPIKQKECILGELVGNKCVTKIYIPAYEEYSCPKGYNLDGMMCEKKDVISATKKENPLYE